MTDEAPTACHISCMELVDARGRSATCSEGARALCMTACSAAGPHDAHRCTTHVPPAPAAAAETPA